MLRIQRQHPHKHQQQRRCIPLHRSRPPVREPEDGDVTRWREVAKLTGHTGDVKSVAVSGDGSRIVMLAVIVSAWSVSVRVEEERR